MSLLTLSAARTALWNYGADQVLATATTAQKLAFAGRLNAAAGELFNLSKFRHAERRINVPVYDGMITLPRYASSCLGARARDCCCSEPLLIYSRFHEFLPGTAQWSCDWGSAVPVTDLAQTFRQPPTGPFKLRTVGSEAVTGNISLIGGRDSSYDEYSSIATLAIANGTTTTTRTWTSLPQIQLPVTTTRTLNVSLYAVDATTSEATLIAIYAPSESVPAYSRYAVPSLCDEDLATCLVRLAFVPVSADTDIVFPSNEAALRHMLSAYQCEDKKDLKNASTLKGWAVNQLNSELALISEPEYKPVSFLGDWGAGSIPQPR